MLTAALLLALLLLALAMPAVAATFTVDSTGDASDASAGDGNCATAGGVCTLRAAIQEANALSGADSVAFAIAGSGPHTITVATALPFISTDLTIDGTTQTGTVCCDGPRNCSSAAWKIIIDRAGGTNGGLRTSGSATVLIKGVEITGIAGNSSDAYGVNVEDNSTVQCVYAHGNWGGIIADGASTIGGLGAGEANLTNDNHFGITIKGPSVAEGNLSGTDKTGATAVPNESIGIFFEGGTGARASGNLASGNSEIGIYVRGDTVNAVIEDNIVGRNRTDSANVCNVLQIDDDGTGTTLTDNIVASCTAPGCCNTSGLEGIGVGCLDETAGLGQPTSQSDCQAKLDAFCAGNPGLCGDPTTATSFNGASTCNPDTGGTCPAAVNTPTATLTATITNTATFTATVTDTPTATSTETPTVTNTPTRTGTNTNTSTPSSTATVTRTATATPTQAVLTPRIVFDVERRREFEAWRTREFEAGRQREFEVW